MIKIKIGIFNSKSKIAKSLIKSLNDLNINYEIDNIKDNIIGINIYDDSRSNEIFGKFLSFLITRKKFSYYSGEDIMSNLWYITEDLFNTNIITGINTVAKLLEQKCIPLKYICNIKFNGNISVYYDSFLNRFLFVKNNKVKIDIAENIFKQYLILSKN